MGYYKMNLKLFPFIIDKKKQDQMNRKHLSSKMKQKQVQTKMLQDQTKKMQQKLSLLKQQVQQQKQLKASTNYESTVSRWRKATNSDAPLKDYAKKILHDQKQAYNKYGINQKKITGTKSFEPVISKMKEQKLQNQQKSGLKIPQLSNTQQTQQLPVTSIQNNFFKAKIETKNLIKRKTLQQFLQQNFLHEYIPVLTNADIKQLQDLYHTKRQRMTELGIKPGHQAKIIKRLKQQLQGQKEEEKQKEKEQNKTEQSSKEKVSFGYGDGDINEYQKIQEEEEREKQKEKQLQDNYNQQNQDEESEDVQSEYDDEVAMITMPNFTQTSLQTGQQQQNESQFTQYNCFQCYRKGLDYPKVSSDSRLFCSDSCLNKYLDYMQKICPQCDSNFYKFDGYFEDGLWFCSIKCSPKRQEIEEMFLEWTKNKQ